MNWYAYVGNDPINMVDPTGKIGVLLLFAPELIALAKATLFVGSAAAAGYAGSEAINAYNESSSPDLPIDIVGDQSDPRAGPNKSGNKHTSGPLTPENGGVGDFETDLGTLAGDTRPAGAGDSAPEGSLVGENGVFGRPENKSGGASIDIPANGDKPHETLHYNIKKQ